MDPIEISKVIDRLRENKAFRLPTLVQTDIPDAKMHFESVLKHLVPVLQWLPEYDSIAEWLSDNKGRGLLCMGNLGRGKTLIATKAIPILFNYFKRLIVRVTDAQELNDKIDVVKQSHIICIDDVGTEGEYVRYGERRIPFAELVDLAEKHGKLLIITTNLTIEELTAKYGERTIDRLRGITKCVLFQGQSMRN